MIRLTQRTMLASLSALIANSARSDTGWPNRPITLVRRFAACAETVARTLRKD